MDVEEARNLVLDKLKAAWDANTPAVNGGTVPSVEYQNVGSSGPPLRQGNAAWARVAVRHVSATQASMGGVGGRLFTRYGQVMVQIFVPAGKQGLLLADRLGKVALAVFEGEETSTGGIWFTDATYKEVGQVDASWFQANVVADFRYDVAK